MIPDCLPQEFRCLVHILHCMGIVQILQCTVEILSDFLISDHIPVPQNARSHGINPEFPRQSVKICFFRIDKPFVHNRSLELLYCSASAILAALTALLN